MKCLQQIRCGGGQRFVGLGGLLGCHDQLDAGLAEHCHRRLEQLGRHAGLAVAHDYLGDAGDYRVAVGGISLRVITEGRVFREFTPGDKVFLSLDDFIVYDDDGSLEEQLKINT